MYTIERCLRISDVTPLQNVKSLTLDRCPKILKIGSLGLGSLESLTLKKCRNIRDLAGLPGANLKRLVLDGMHNISDVSGLGALAELELIDCPAISSIGSLASVGRLVVQRCRGVRDADLLAALPNVKLDEGDCGCHPDTEPLSPTPSVEHASSSRAHHGATSSPPLGEQGLTTDLQDRAASTSPEVSLRPGSLSADAENAVGAPTDWVESARLARDLAQQEQLKALQRAEEAACDARLAEAEALLAEDEAKLRLEAEQLARFYEVHVHGREKRRQQALARKQTLEQAAVEAKAEVEALAAISEMSTEGSAENEREARKARVAAMLSKVKGVRKLSVVGC